MQVTQYQKSRRRMRSRGGGGRMPTRKESRMTGDLFLQSESLLLHKNKGLLNGELNWKAYLAAG